MPFFRAWAWAFGLTLLMELPVYTVVPAPLPWPRRLLLGLGLNLATHPLLWYAFPRFHPYFLWALVAESWVTLTEALLLAAAWRGQFPKALLVSFLANLLSTLTGLYVS